MDTAEAVSQLRASQQLGQALSSSARQQGALGLATHDDAQAWAARTQAMDPAAEGKLPATLNGQDARKAAAGASQGGRTLQDPVEAFAQALLHLDTPSTAALVSTQHLSSFSGQDTSLSAHGDAHLTAARTLSAVSGQTTSLYTHAGGIQAIAANASLSLRAHTDAQQLWADQDITVQSTTDEVRVFAQDSITLTAGQSQIVIQGGDITFTCPGSFTVKGASHDWSGGASQAAQLDALPEGAATQAPNEIELHYHHEDLSPVKGATYKLTFESGAVLTGQLDDEGYKLLSGVPTGPYWVEYGEGSQPWSAPPLEESKEPYQDPATQAQGRALFEKRDRQGESV